MLTILAEDLPGKDEKYESNLNALLGKKQILLSILKHFLDIVMKLARKREVWPDSKMQLIFR